MSDDAIKLVAFDMDGCLAADPTVWELVHRRLGTWDSHGRPYWQRFLAGGLDYDEFARMDVAVWRGAPLEYLRRAADEVPLMPGCAEVLGTLTAGGVTVAIITNGLECVAERFRDGFGVAHTFANRVASDGSALTGELDVRVPHASKGRILADLTGRLGLEAPQVAAVGDSAADVAMFRCARVSIAFGAGDPAVRAAATHVVDGGDLRPLLPILLGDGAAA